MEKCNPPIKVNEFCNGEYVGEPGKEHYLLEAVIQNGPIKEVGKNGCQIDDVITFCLHFIEELHEKFPCNENRIAIDLLLNTIRVLALRKKDREKRGVEGEKKL
jgi:hypothetical protein